MVRFNTDTDLPDLTGKVILVTGGNVGLGKETITQFSKHNPAHIYLAARNESKALAAIQDIKKTVPNAAPITFLEVDLTSFESVKRAASEFRSKSETLHILVNNAGIMAWPPGTTKEGYEIQFGTNHMGHALLTKLLLPTLQHTAKTGPDKDVRIVSLSSMAESWVPSDLYNFADLKTDMASVGTWARYGASKVANIHHAKALAKRYPEIRCVAVHPGAVSTNLVSGPAASWPIIKPLIGFASWLAFSSVSNGAKNQIWASVSPDAETGVFYWPVGVKGRDSKHAKDEDLSEKLWEWTEKELEAYA
ncbi:Putative short-chain dehydrogenase/reductase SDR, NAD(P)-binding domain superfamily [Colletotrichum destructivum]|uniref:Short-chain dehydrogenase/reductase SDR, NAD(P)-binding domain superfamily n=1 Tax=Colletotrichum destructivum TaxID=34406 RepID=A0AAX4I0B8_9PEZI|nr:Putative short-chain dehydrogenase/reductase SDR, NAD(P)-binding domain superfamily [Colletotrichum destructivum]